MTTTIRRFAGPLAGLLLGALAGCAGSEGEAVEAAPPAAADMATEPADPAPDEHKNVIKWTTASEVDNFGYDIYRGESEDGPFVVINDEPLAGAGTTDEISAYRYEDRDIDPTKRYYYYVESISMAGEREAFTPVFAAEPKAKPEGEPPADADPAG